MFVGGITRKLTVFVDIETLLRPSEGPHCCGCLALRVVKQLEVAQGLIRWESKANFAIESARGPCETGEDLSGLSPRNVIERQLEVGRKPGLQIL